MDSPANPPPHLHATAPPPTGGLVLLTLLAALLLRAFWRFGLAWDIAHAAAADAQAGRVAAPLFWQTLDPLAGWLALLVLALSNRLTDPHAKRANALEGAGLLTALAFWWTSAAVPDTPWRGHFELAAALPMLLVAVALVWRELRTLAAATSPRHPASSTPAPPQGINIEQLWRLVAAQWILVWVAAQLYLLFKLRAAGAAAGGLMANPPARTLLFLLPAAGVLPNVLMAVGIRWWGHLVGRPRHLAPRQRAWLLALALHNLGAALVFAGPRWLAAIGALLMIAATALYLAGFPIVPAIGAGLLLLAWTWAAAAWAMLALERLIEASGQPVLMHFTAAWRIALTDGLPLTWLLAIGVMTLRTRLIAPLQMRPLTWLVAALLTLAIALFAATWLLSIENRLWVQCLLAASALSCAALVLGAVACLRATQLLKSPAPS